jgi:hypothetical protein
MLHTHLEKKSMNLILSKNREQPSSVVFNESTKDGVSLLQEAVHL